MIRNSLIYILLRRICFFINIFKYLPRKYDEQYNFFRLLRSVLKNKDKYSFLFDKNNIHVIENISNQFLREDVLFDIIDNHYGNKSIPKILVFSHELSLTGAPKVALFLSKILKNIYGVSPIVVSLKDGPIRKEFYSENIEILDIAISIYNGNYIKNLVEKFDLVIVNSWCFPIMDVLAQTRTRKIWWSHDTFTQNEEFDIIKKFMPCLHECWSGSPLTQDKLTEIYPLKKNFLMLYGLDDLYIENIKHENIVFSVMGSISNRKGQDVLIDAIKLLSDDTLKKCQFLIIGENIDNNLYQRIEDASRNYSMIRYYNSVPFEKLLDFYAKSDVIIIPSRYDPMPIVAIYAFMFKKICVCSDKTGTARFINNKKNGLIFESENSKELANIIKDITWNMKNYNEIAKNGRKIYDEYFSVRMFEENVKAKLQDILK